ncbi:MAG: prepilin-type N-terminal cleavage/methylation domain-containing protein [Sedimentisphaerales bacterium]|nr:prepilin-type N-terminal cleavage/methylation domain-containing protein [Sedimentisphaerales bacterium]
MIRHTPTIHDLRQRRTRLTGLTLVEVLMVVVILGIAATIAITSTGDTSDMQVRAATRELTSILLYTQTQAIASQQVRKVVFDDAQHGYRVEDIDGNIIPDPLNAPPAGADPNDYGMQKKFPETKTYKKVTINAVDFNGTDTVWFNDLGAPYGGDDLPLNAAGSVTLGAGTFQIRIDVEPVSGRIKLTEL